MMLKLDLVRIVRQNAVRCQEAQKQFELQEGSW